MLDAPHRQLIAVGRGSGIGRVALALFDREPILNFLALGMVEADAKHIGVGELVDALVDLAEDRVEVERGCDLAANLAEQLDVALAFALGASELFGSVRAQPDFVDLCAFALARHDAAAL